MNELVKTGMLLLLLLIIILIKSLLGLLVMLSFLEHENPLVRHASKNWLNESLPEFYRIIDPLFEVNISI